MNATKRKFNALLQGIGSRSGPATDDRADARHSFLDSAPATTRSPDDSPLAPATLAASPASTASASSATTTTSSVAARMEFLAKRRRTTLSAAAAAASRAAAAGTTTSSDLLRRWGSSSSSAGGLTGLTGQTTTTQTMQPPAPRFCPDDREQLLRRLATFQELTDWMPKPDRINEIEWAKRGWVCQGKERVRCTLCSKEVVVQLSRAPEHGGGSGGTDGDGGGGDDAAAATEADAGEALVDRYADLLVAAHQEDCLWRKKGCASSLLRLPLASPRQAVADLRQRYDELCARKDFLPYAFNLRLPAGLDLDAVLSTLPPDFFDTKPAAAAAAAAAEAPDTPSTPPAPNRAALALALLGWQGLTNSRIGAVPNSASCHACLRRLGLWMFKSKHVDPDTGAVLEPAPMDHLDGVREHRFFCPWRNGAVQRNPGGARTGRGHPPQQTAANGSGDDGPPPGWLVLVQMLRNDAYLRNRVGARRAAAPAPAADSRPATPGGAAAEASPRTAAGSPDASGGPAAEPPTTPVRKAVAEAGGDVPGDRAEDEEDEASREAKDKERWARLRRVKSLFDTKGTMAKKLKRASIVSTSGGGSSRPGTSHTVSARPPGPSAA